MSNFKKTKIAKITTGVVGALTALAMAGGVAILPAFAADDIASQIAALMAQIQMLQAKLGTSQSTPVMGAYNFSVNLTLGSTGADVMKLQQALNSDADTIVAITGAGSKGNETSFFGPATKAAVMKFQAKHGIAPVAGYVGSITRAKLNSMFASAPVVTPGTPVVTPGVAGSLTVTAATMQPANALAPANATRIPFTKFTVTAGATDVPLTSVTVERTGSSVDAALDSIVLLDENGDQIGISKTLNSTHRATVGDPIVIKAGTSRTFTIGANRPAAGANGGTTVSLDVVAINTTASVVGDMLPIRGATHTINENLVIGTVTISRGGIDPGADQTKEIGTVSYTFSSVKVTAGSAEALTLKSIRWNQVESASVADLANLKTYVDGVAYDAVTTDGGRFYTSTFGNGILIEKGFSKDISIKGDIIGGSSRKIAFDIAKRTDINLVGNVYGYGVLPPLGTNPAGTVSQFINAEDPWYNGATVTMSNGTMTVSSDNTIGAQNIAVNLANQPLGGWSVEVRGEPISVAKMVFNVTAIGDQVANITNIVLVDANGSVLAGPVDGSGAAQSGTITFTDSVTFPAGITKLALKGKISADFSTNDTITASTTPGTQWTTVRGQVTGNSITPSPASSALTASTMTVKAGALALSVSSQPVAQNVIAGANQFEFSRIILDAGQSGEDLRVTSLPLLLTYSGIAATNLSSCQLYDGATSVTSGGNVKNPSVATGNEETFIFDGTGLMIPKGTSKTLSVKCNVASNITGSVSWGIKTGFDISSASGVNSGQTITETATASNGNTMTLAASGSYSVSADSGEAYVYRVVRANTEVALAALRFTASSNEDMTVKQIALSLGGVVASSSATDLVGEQVTLWDGATQVGVGQFTTSRFATSTLTTAFVIPKGGVKTIVIKGALSEQGDKKPGTPGSLLSINYDGNNNGLNGNFATGADSGATISGASASTDTAGVRIFRNVPTVQITSVNGGGLVSGGATYKFSVHNPGARDMAISKVSFSIATSTNVTGFYLKDSSNNSSATAEAPTGTLTIPLTGNMRVIGAGLTKTYTLYATLVANPNTTVDSLTVKLLDDTTYPSLTTLMGTTAEVAASNLIWTPYSTTTDVTVDNAVYDGYRDWTNSYGLFNGVSLDPQTFQSAN